MRLGTRRGPRSPAGFIESFLLRTDEGTWRIGTLWESREALMAMRASGGKPAALVMFERAGTRPTVSLWDVDRHVSAST